MARWATVVCLGALPACAPAPSYSEPSAVEPPHTEPPTEHVRPDPQLPASPPAETGDTAANGDCPSTSTVRRLHGQLAIVDAAMAKIIGRADDYLGIALAPLGDVNGDGFGDVAMHAQRATAIGNAPGVMFVAHGSFHGTHLADDVAIILYEDDAGDNELTLGSEPITDLGDVDGDGLDDIAVASPSQDGSDVFVCTEWVGAPGDRVTLDASYAHIDASSTADYGDTLSSADLNGDGYRDLIATNPYFVIVGDTVGYFGRVDAYYGPIAAGEHTMSEAQVSMIGTDPAAAVGSPFIGGAGVAGLGDVNGDGLDELAAVQIAAEGPARQRTGAVHVLFGPGAVGLTTDDADGIRFGQFVDELVGTVADVGDVNGDGYADLAVGSASDVNGVDSGSTYVFLTPTVGVDTVATAEFRVDGLDALDAVALVGPAGDLDEDGFADLVIGAEEVNGDGTDGVYVIYGPPPLGTHVATDIADATIEIGGDGWNVRGTTDWDGDCQPDLVVGARWDTEGGSYAGAVYVIPAGLELL